MHITRKKNARLPLCLSPPENIATKKQARLRLFVGKVGLDRQSSASSEPWSSLMDLICISDDFKSISVKAISLSCLT